MQNGNAGRFWMAGMLLAAIWLVTGTGALAEDASPRLELKITSLKEVVTVVDGKEVVEHVAADRAKPGDVVLYTIAYTNKGSAEARNATIVDPVPEGTDYVLGSAEGAGAEVTCSIDGGKSYHREPVKHVVTRPDGKKEEVEATPDMYTHVRWVVENIQAGKSGKVSLKVKLE